MAEVPKEGQGHSVREGIDQDCSFGTVFRTRDRGMGAMALQGLLGGSLGRNVLQTRKGAVSGPQPQPRSQPGLLAHHGVRESPPGLDLSSTV